MKLRYLIPLFLSACSQPEQTSEWRPMSVVEASDSSIPGNAQTKIMFESGDSLVMPLTRLRVLSTIPTSGSAPWLVLAGIECTFCDAPEIVVFAKADAGVASLQSHSYPYPGEQLEVGVGPEIPHYRSQMFVGKCADSGSGSIIVGEARDSTGNWKKSMRIITLNSALTDSVLPWNSVMHERIKDAVTRGDCTEIPGRKQHVF